MSKLGRWLPLLAVLGLLGAAMVAAVYANPVIQNLPAVGRPISQPPPQPPVAEPPRSPQPSFSLPPPDSGSTLPPWVTWLIGALCAAGATVLIVSLLWMALRDRLMDRKVPLRVLEDPEQAAQQLRARIRGVLDEGLADLDDADLDPRRAVIACWVRLEEAAAVAGTPREPADTPADLVARLLASHAVSADVLASFADVYREARFAAHVVDVTMREQARAALRRVRDELANAVAAQPASADESEPAR